MSPQRLVRSILISLLAIGFAFANELRGQQTQQQQNGQLTRKLNIVILEGQEAINNIKRRTAREAIVRVEDENRMPVAGASVTAILPQNGPSAVFVDGGRTLTTTTGRDGILKFTIRPNRVPGKFQMQINASAGPNTAVTAVTQTNVLLAAAGGTILGVSAPIFIAVVGGAAAAAVGAGVGLSGGGAPPAKVPSVGVGVGGPVVVGPPR